MIKNCKQCGDEFETGDKSWRIYCDECAFVRNVANAKHWTPEQRERHIKIIGGNPSTMGNCQMCGDEFRLIGKRMHCPKCSYLIHSKNLSKFTPEEMELHHEMRKRAYPDGYKYATQYPSTHRATKVVQKRDNAMSQEHASESWQRWPIKDIEFIDRNKHTMTALEMARELHRTYRAVTRQASLNKITLMTGDKRRGRLVSHQKMKKIIKGNNESRMKMDR